MRHLLSSGCVLGLIALTSVAFGQDTDHHRIHMPEDPIEHKEIRLPENLLPGLPIVNQSLSMEEAVQIGLENNLGVKVAEFETDVRKAMLKGAKGERWPVISLGSLTFLRGGDSQTLMTPDMMMNTVDTTLFQDFNATARLPLFTGGLIRGRIQAAQFSWLGSESALKQALVETTYQIQEAYLNALLSQEEHLVHQSHIDVQQVLLKNAGARYRVGKGLKADVLRVQAELADAQRMLNEEHNKLNASLFDLKATLGIDLASNITLSQSLMFTSWNGPDMKAIVQEAVLNHPRVQEAEKRVKEAEAQLKVAKSQYLPQVYGQVTGNLRLPDRPPMMGNGVIGMVTAQLPVFSRVRGAEVEQAKAALLKAQQEYKAIQLEITQEIAKAWSEMEFARQNVTLSEPAVAEAQENLRLLQRRYEVGRAISVEVQDAALVLRQAQLNRATALYNHELAKAKLYRTLGRVSITNK